LEQEILTNQYKITSSGVGKGGVVKNFLSGESWGGMEQEVLTRKNLSNKDNNLENERNCRS